MIYFTGQLPKIENLIKKIKKKEKGSFEELSIIWRMKEILTDEEINMIDQDLKNRLDEATKGCCIKSEITECISMEPKINK